MMQQRLPAYLIIIFMLFEYKKPLKDVTLVTFTAVEIDLLCCNAPF